MTRSELVARIAEANPELSRAEVKRAVDAVFARIGEALAEGDSIQLRGFGVFSVKTRAPRASRNPRTGEAIQVGDRRGLRFKAGMTLRRRVNGEG